MSETKDYYAILPKKSPEDVNSRLSTIGLTKIFFALMFFLYAIFQQDISAMGYDHKVHTEKIKEQAMDRLFGFISNRNSRPKPSLFRASELGNWGFFLAVFYFISGLFFFLTGMMQGGRKANIKQIGYFLSGVSAVGVALASSVFIIAVTNKFGDAHRVLDMGIALVVTMGCVFFSAISFSGDLDIEDEEPKEPVLSQ